MCLFIFSPHSSIQTEREQKTADRQKLFSAFERRARRVFSRIWSKGRVGLTQPPLDGGFRCSYLLMFPGATKGRFPRLIETLFRFPSADRNFCMYMRFRKETAAAGCIFVLSPPGVFSLCVCALWRRQRWTRIKSERRARASAALHKKCNTRSLFQQRL